MFDQNAYSSPKVVILVTKTKINYDKFFARLSNEIKDLKLKQEEFASNNFKAATSIVTNIEDTEVVYRSSNLIYTELKV